MNKIVLRTVFYMDFIGVLKNMIFLILHVTNTESFPPPLSKKEERLLLEQKESGDVKAKNKLIEHNLRLVVHVIKKYYSIIWNTK